MRAWLVLGLMMSTAARAQAQNFEALFDEEGRWAEVQTQLPSYPKSEDYLPFKVNAIASFDFFIDGKSISVGGDGVVRYSLIAQSAAGVLNISYEGIRCSGGQFRLYALGRSDATWSRARNSQWKDITGDRNNAQRSVLYTDFFCPAHGIIESSDEGVQGLKRGGNRRANTLGR